MVRKAKNAPNPAKMYRHFAVVTVIITAAVALMADSDSRREVVVAVEEHQDRAELQAKSDAMFQSGSLIDNSNSRNVAGEFGDDSWVGYAGSGTSSSRPPSSNATQSPPWVRLGMSQEQYEMLPPEERERLLAQLGPETMDQATMARISEQSMRRAGRTTPSADAPGASNP
ncbi:hypothetical protein ACFCW2_13170 [Qipengyuania sp. DSG2-2]|uniref:hypothetical protein n=1 Tax=Qipengyuania sp. DGS2-2 TaxID=3349631 RepID=UPI0036D38373